VQTQGDCCGIHWSGGARLWFRPTSADKSVTHTFKLPTSGTYSMEAAQTLARDCGVNVLSVDARAVGSAFDGYLANGVQVSDPIAYGDVDLSAGRHRVTLTVTGRNQAATGYLAYFRFTLGG